MIAVGEVRSRAGGGEDGPELAVAVVDEFCAEFDREWEEGIVQRVDAAADAVAGFYDGYVEARSVQALGGG